MNKTAIKNYAVWARRKLIESAKQRAYEIEIIDGGVNDPTQDTIAGHPLSPAEKAQRAQLIGEIGNRGYEAVMEEAAYTWFNRFIALRFMEVNGYLPSKVRVFTDENGEFRPEILKQALNVDLDGLDRERILALKDAADDESLYQYLLITQCNALNEALPYMFETLSNWTELLFPANLLRPDSVIGRMISDIPEEDWTDTVEIIGWLYQYYISEKHEEVIDPLHGKIIKKEDIPAATQLFTPDWIVRYILDNSLGRYWIERNPESSLESKLAYFIKPKNGKIERIDEYIAPEKIKVFDPCVGSGHFLSYAFDVLLEIYRESGWADRDAAKSIVENNLYGLDIDDRAAQLACFAVTMKARKYNRRILSSNTVLNVMSLRDSVSINDELLSYAAGGNQAIHSGLEKVYQTFIHAKELGSITKLPQIDIDVLKKHIENFLSETPGNLVDLHRHEEIRNNLLPLLKQTEILSLKYEVAATNPPYLNRYSPILKKYIEENYGDYKGDLFSVFIYRNFEFCKPGGYSGFMTPNVWMFIKSYVELRRFVIKTKQITTLIQLAKGAFFKEATVDICAFVLSKEKTDGKGLYLRLEDFKGGMEVQRQKVEEAIADPECKYLFESNQENFSKIPGSPIAYWLSDVYYFIYETSKPFEYFAKPRVGLQTSDNNRFLRLWFEVNFKKMGVNFSNRFSAAKSKYKWFPYNKGGEYKKWYGNNSYVVNWENDGKELREYNAYLNSSRASNIGIGNTEFYFKENGTWSAISSGNLSVRYSDKGFINSNAGMAVYSENLLKYIIAFLNSSCCASFLSITSQTINYNVGDNVKIPFIISKENQLFIENCSDNCINLSKDDYDSFETSWDFKKHPLI